MPSDSCLKESTGTYSLSLSLSIVLIWNLLYRACLPLSHRDPAFLVLKLKLYVTGDTWLEG